MQTSVNQGHGPHRGAVASPQALTHSQATFRRSWSALARYASGAERDSLGFAHRCSLARPTRPLSALSNLPSPLSAVATRRHADSAVARAGRRPASTWQAGSVGDLYRRQLQLGEKGGAAVGPTRRGKGSKIMAIADRHGLPIACSIASASPHDRIQLIAPHKYNRRRKNTQDGRELRRYCRRWKIERLFAWLHNFRRLVNRWEYHEANFLAMLQLGCLVILLRHL